MGEKGRITTSYLIDLVSLCSWPNERNQILENKQPYK